MSLDAQRDFSSGEEKLRWRFLLASCQVRTDAECVALAWPTVHRRIRCFRERSLRNSGCFPFLPLYLLAPNPIAGNDVAGFLTVFAINCRRSRRNAAIISATNSGGTSNATLSILFAPAIDCTDTLHGTGGLNFTSFQISTDAVTSFGATGFPPGRFTLNSATEKDRSLAISHLLRTPPVTCMVTGAMVQARQFTG